MIIAIDGPAASGKGTLGKRLAQHYGYRHLDTGVIYRAVAKMLLDQGFELTDEARAVAAAMELDPEKFGHPELKSQRIGEAASVVSAIPKVREALVSFQRQFAADPPGAVLDGRDIGTVICPDADVKLFVTASLEARAVRRFQELRQRGQITIYDSVLQDLLHGYLLAFQPPPVDDRAWRSIEVLLHAPATIASTAIKEKTRLRIWKPSSTARRPRVHRRHDRGASAVHLSTTIFGNSAASLRN